MKTADSKSAKLYISPRINSRADLTDSAIGSADSCSTDSCLESAASSLEIDNSKAAPNTSIKDSFSVKNGDHLRQSDSCNFYNDSLSSVNSKNDINISYDVSTGLHDDSTLSMEGHGSYQLLPPPDPHVPEQIAAYISLYLRTNVKPKGNTTI